MGRPGAPVRRARRLSGGGRRDCQHDGRLDANCRRGGSPPFAAAPPRRQVLILDLEPPRDFDPAVADVDDNVFLYDLDALEATCERNRRERVKEVDRARRIIAEETDRFLHDIYHKATGPIIARLRQEWQLVRESEVRQLFGKLNRLTDEDRQAIERSIERIFNKLLHPPLEALRDEARKGTPHGLTDALKRLFGLGD